MNQPLQVMTWAIDLASPFALGTSFRYTIKSDTPPIGNPLNGEVWFGEFTSLSANRPITGMVAVIYDDASNRWLPLSVAFRFGADEYVVQFKCVLKLGRIMVITMTLGDDKVEM